MPRFLLPASLVLWIAAGCASEGASNEVVHLIRNARYAEAVDLAARRAERDPDDEAAQALHRDATVAFHLDQGRQALFEHRLEDALVAFNQALAVSPENPVVHQWLERARDELTLRWLDVGRNYLLADRFEEALEAYELALYYTPGHREALFGASRVLFLINYRAGLGEDYYNQGIRAVHEHFLRQARAKFSYSSKYSDDARARDRKDQVESELAEERFYRGKAFEAEGRYGAAHTEYRLVLLFEPDHEAARDGLERMRDELEAQRELSEAQKLIRQHRFEEALLALERGRALTQLQGDEFTRLVNEIEVSHWEALYQRARNEERDFRYEKAIETYGELLELAEFYADADVRKRTLEDYVARATELDAAVEQAEDPRERLELLREIELLWPEYRDLQERIRATEEELAAASGEPAAPAETAEPVEPGEPGEEP